MKIVGCKAAGYGPDQSITAGLWGSLYVGITLQDYGVSLRGDHTARHGDFDSAGVIFRFRARSLSSPSSLSLQP